MDDEVIEDIDSVNDEIDETSALEVEEVIEETQEDSEEDTTDWKAEALKQKAINARMAKKLNKPRPAPVVEQTQSTNSIDSDTVDEKILKSTKGYDEEAMEKLKVVAKGLGTDLFKAEADPLFQDYLARKQADERKEKAKLGSSKGSQVSQEKSISDLTDEEHKALVLETMSKVN